MTLRIFSLQLVAMCLLPVTAGAQEITKTPYFPDSGSLVVHCGSLIDGVSDEPQSDRAVGIIDGRIMFVRNASADDRYAVPVLDLSNYTCLPGLIDTHTHLTDRSDETADLSIYYTRSIELEREISRANAAVTLAAGFTTVRNLGAYGGWSGRDLRDRINGGELVGPRVQTAGFYLTIPAGGGDLVIPGIDESEIPERVRLGVTRGPEGFRRKAEEAVAGGADVLKVIASGCGARIRRRSRLPGDDRGRNQSCCRCGTCGWHQSYGSCPRCTVNQGCDKCWRGLNRTRFPRG
ncbi:MAG: hypothetical protein DRQ63_12025 [Gammaproteobacteria bacterium]|nr:MAG: hypothetical protein DRQ63_12025 [Gammaproteobacteria bacterium]